MKIKEKAVKIVEALKKEYPDAICSLTNGNALQLLIAARLSAQCTDSRVNIVTKELFAKFRDAEDFAIANIEDIENIIHSCGLYKTKARDIKNMCRMIIDSFNGEIPDNMEDLLKLPGVGRKTANLILGDIFNRPAVVVDTHCIRISNRLGLVKTTNTFKIETALKRIIPPDEASDFCHRLVLHGRAVCKARNPQCNKCCLNPLCDNNNISA